MQHSHTREKYKRQELVLSRIISEVYKGVALAGFEVPEIIVTFSDGSTE
jgi:hypothetical protein